MGIELPFWLRDSRLDLIFHEGEDDEGTEDDDAEEDEEDEDEKDDESKDKKSEGDTSGLKSALEKERAERKKLEKEAKALRKFKEEQDAKGKSDAEKATDAATKASATAVKLAAKLQTNAVDTEIIKAAGRVQLPNGAKFADVDDALRLIDRGAIEVEQDEDDPSDVEINSDSVEKALKALAKKKPHLLVATKKDDDDQDEEEDEKPSKSSTGSKVGSRGTRDKGKIKEDELRARYPMLIRR